jgi:hypothetical protein
MTTGNAGVERTEIAPVRDVSASVRQCTPRFVG